MREFGIMRFGIFEMSSQPAASILYMLDPRRPGRSMMRRQIFLLMSSLAILGLAAALLPANARDRVRCSGHELFPTPRPELSCTDLKPKVYPSPDGALHALVLPADVSLYASPDTESRVVLRTGKGDTLASKDHSSPRGMNGYYVVTARWSPDSQ